MEPETWANRLVTVIDKALDDGVSSRELARRAGIGKTSIYNLRMGDRVPSVDLVLRICRALNVSPVYIFTGFELSPELQDFLQTFEQLPPQQRQILVALLEQLKAGAPL